MGGGRMGGEEAASYNIYNITRGETIASETLLAGFCDRSTITYSVSVFNHQCTTVEAG